MSQPGGQSPKITLIISILGVIVAILAVVTGVLGYQAAAINKQKEQAQASATSSGSDLSILQGQYDQLKTQNNQLRAQNDQLRSQLPGPTADPRAPADPTIRHRAQISLSSSGRGLDLDAPQSDPQWKVAPSGSVDIYYLTQQEIFPDTYAGILSLGNARADYMSCRGNTGYGNKSIPRASLEVGTYLCVKTSEKRFAALRLIDINADKATFDVVTYDPPDAS